MPQKPAPWSIELNCLERVFESLKKHTQSHASECGCIACNALLAVVIASNAVDMLAMDLASDWLTPAEDPPPPPKPAPKPKGTSGPYGSDGERR
jgi:hypothetical protein